MDRRYPGRSHYGVLEVTRMARSRLGKAVRVLSPTVFNSLHFRASREINLVTGRYWCDEVLQQAGVGVPAARRRNDGSLPGHQRWIGRVV